MPYHSNVKSKPVTLVELPEFQRLAHALLTERELDDLKAFLAFNPEAGVVMKGTGGVRKLRWAIGAKGKSGGSRIICYYQDLRFPILLITLFAKNVRVDLSQAQQNRLKQLIEVIKQTRRTS
ncbi:MAG: addiction module toxin RelE [Magnetococcales bacterium]|nr:addiction module toxin RelE [Magnetococcales bacterium]